MQLILLSLTIIKLLFHRIYSFLLFINFSITIRNIFVQFPYFCLCNTIVLQFRFYVWEFISFSMYIFSKMANAFFVSTKSSSFLFTICDVSFLSFCNSSKASTYCCSTSSNCSSFTSIFVIHLKLFLLYFNFCNSSKASTYCCSTTSNCSSFTSIFI